MKVLHFKNDLESESFLKTNQNIFFEKERIFLKFHPEVSRSLKIELITYLNSVSTNLALITNLEEFSNYYLPLNMERILYFIEISNLNGSNIKDDYDDNSSHDSRAYPIHESNSKINKYPTFKFSYVLPLTENNLYKFDSMLIVATEQNPAREVMIDHTSLGNASASKLKNKFELLKSYSNLQNFIYFSPFNTDSEKWEAATKNPYRGPQYIDIDFSNFCTHNCVFCGLYNDETKQKVLEKKLPDSVTKKLYNGQLSKEAFSQILKELPHNIKCMNLGGAGEPSSHPNFFDFLRELRIRNISINVFSHFAYMTPARIDELHLLGNEDPKGFHFIINISAATGETYSKIRSNQSPEIFEKILNNLKILTGKRKQDGKGTFFTYMSVTNALNFHEMPLMVYKSFEVGASELWIKPIEAHGEESHKYLISEKQQLDYLINLKLTLYFAEHFGVEIKHKVVIDLILEKYESILADHFLTNSFNYYIKKSLITFPELGQAFTGAKTNLTKLKTNFQPLEKFEADLNLTDNIQNGGISNILYDKIPCSIGYEYIRFGVNHEVWPCCIANRPQSRSGNAGIKANWHNDQITNFRKITGDFPQTKLHRTDKDWNFCQQCPHIHINEEYFRLSRLD